MSAFGEFVFERFIPTRVGNTCSGYANNGRSPVHPHACGEYSAALSKALVNARFIPTRVGNTPYLGTITR